MAAIVGNGLAVKEATDEPDSLVQALEARAVGVPEVEAECLVFAPEVAGPEAKDQAAVGDVVQRGGELRDVPRVAESDGCHQHADPRRLAQWRQGRQRRPALVLGPAPVAQIGKQVVLGPQGVEAGTIRRLPRLAKRPPVGSLHPEAGSKAHVKHTLG